MWLEKISQRKVTYTENVEMHPIKGPTTGDP